MKHLPIWICITAYLGCFDVRISAQTETVTISIQQELKETETPKPISWVVLPDGSGRSLLVLQGGQVLIVPADRKKSKVTSFLKLSSDQMIMKDFEEGLLGLVFHPKYQSNGLFYLYHTLQSPKRSVLVERRVKDLNRLELDSSHDRTLLVIGQPYWNHNSGVPEFGPDGYLYLSTGDGGKANDPHDFSQNTFSLLGKVLRIDVDQTEGALQYRIPNDNPFKDQPGYRGEIWTTGMRNPWRLHWDLPSKTLYCADVGQHQKEEINLIKRGGNYGWSFREGTGKFSLKNRKPSPDVKFIDPVFEYGHDEGTSVSGGIVYRGSKYPELYGHYIFGDWGTGKCWAIEVKNNLTVSKKYIEFTLDGEVINDLPKFVNGKPQSPFKPVNFCMSAKNELVLLDWQGMVYFTK
jgi:quinoprotein glucose dehydrogenase